MQLISSALLANPRVRGGINPAVVKDGCKETTCREVLHPFLQCQRCSLHRHQILRKNSTHVDIQLQWFLRMKQTPQSNVDQSHLMVSRLVWLVLVEERQSDKARDITDHGMSDVREERYPGRESLIGEHAPEPGRTSASEGRDKPRLGRESVNVTKFSERNSIMSTLNHEGQHSLLRIHLSV